MEAATTHIGVVGAGIMGSGLTEVAARAGFCVLLRSRTQDAAEATLAQVAASFAKQVAKGRLEEADGQAALARISLTIHLEDLERCDIVIESVVENLEIKKTLFAGLDEAVKPEAILATNTSTLPVIELAAWTNRADKVCGIHFFNPAPAMALVEIVRPLTASDDTMATAVAFARACGKEPVEVADRAGFIVNALLFPYLNSAVRMLEEGTATMADIDSAMKGGCNFPMGPFALLDLVGLDTTVAILDALHAESGDGSSKVRPTLRRMVTAGLLGRKTGRGFYDYRK